MNFLFYLLTDIEVKNHEVHEKPIGISDTNTAIINKVTALTLYIIILYYEHNTF